MASDEHAMDAMRYLFHIAKIQNEYDKMCEENSVREYDEKVCLRTCPFYKIGGLYCKRAYFYQKALEEAAAKCKECKLERKEALDCYEDLCQREIQEAYERGKAETVKHGHWVGIEYDSYADGCPVYDKWECSICGNEIQTEDPPLYCCDCGALMDEEVE